MDFALPEIGEGVYEAEVVAWHVKPGDSVKRGQTLLEVMTDKATMDLPSPFSGTVVSLRAEPGQRVKVGSALLDYTPVGQPVAVGANVGGQESARSLAAERPAPAVLRNGPARRPDGQATVKAAPSVRLLARKLGIDVTSVHGTGPDGRILIQDLTERLTRTDRADGGKQPAEPKPDYGRPGSRIQLRGLRRTIAERMARAKRDIPDYTYVEECDVTELVNLRTSLRDSFAGAGIKLTYLPFVVRAVVGALKEVPIVNSSLDEKAGEIILHDRYHIGIAVATPAGLIVPVIHDADKKDLPTVAREIERLGNEARAGRAKLDDLRGGTFTVTSVGNLGGLFSTPVINPPEVGILGLGKVVKRPVYDENDTIRPAHVLYLSFTFDHRVIDGAVCVAYSNAVCRQLNHPAALLLPERL
jgi:pyruvate dehydrogenase E2 component (dihydrolipoamide acetyltransferase)/2-oxoisovalerate dehydrogenase E2 component (dihydrolipoyl transacylase)